MIEKDIQDEANAINLYKQIIEMALKEEDVTTAFLFKQILQEEEDHHDTFTSLMEDM
jgi:bacterioferritin